MTTDMKRYTSLKSNLFSSHSSSIVSQNIVYMQMSHHYRRLLNAKSNVDSSQPRSFRATQDRARRPRRIVSVDTSQDSFVEEPSPSDMELVDKIVYDNKHRPDVIYRDHLAGTRNHNHRYPSAPPRHDCTESRRITEQPKPTQRGPRSCTRRIANKPPPSDLIDRHCDDFECPNRYKPRILKSTAQSRVRDLKVYHPPRRKPKLEKTDNWDTPIHTEVEQQRGEEHVTEADEWLQSQTVQKDVGPRRPLCAQCQREITLEQPSSKVSIGSRDSAYNGGVSSGGESRGPTPEQINLANLSTNPARCEGCPLRLSGKLYDRAEYEVPSNINNRYHKDRSSSSSPRRQSIQSTTDRKVHQDKRTNNRPYSSCVYSPTRQRVGNFDHIASTDKRVPGLELAVVKDDVRYAAFSQQITEDILSREILSSKGINKVFQRHMEENMEFLDMTLMQAEIDLLRIQLDLGENDDSSQNTLSESSESSNPPKLVSDIRSRISPSNSSNSSLPVLTSGGNNDVDLLYTSTSCRAPCHNRYSKVTVRDQLVQSGDSSQHFETNQNEPQSLPSETSRANKKLKECLDVVSTEMQTDPYPFKELSLEEIVKLSSSDTNADVSSLKMAIKEILEQILTDNINSMTEVEDNNVAVDNEMDNVPNDSEHSEDDLNNMAPVDEADYVSDNEDSVKSDQNNLENDVPVDELNNNETNNIPNDGEDAVGNLEGDESKGSSIEPNTGFKDSWVSQESTSSTNVSPPKATLGEDPITDNSGSETTRCCFIKKKKKPKDANNPPTNVISPSIKTKDKLEQNKNEETPLALFEKRSSNRHTFDTDAIDVLGHPQNAPKTTKEESWVAMEEPKDGNASSVSSSKSSIVSVPSLPAADTPRVRKVSDASTRRRSTITEVASSSSSSSASTASAAQRNLRTEVRRSFEARQNRSLSKSDSD